MMKCGDVLTKTGMIFHCDSMSRLPVSGGSAPLTLQAAPIGSEVHVPRQHDDENGSGPGVLLLAIVMDA